MDLSIFRELAAWNPNARVALEGYGLCQSADGGTTCVCIKNPKSVKAHVCYQGCGSRPRAIHAPGL